MRANRDFRDLFAELTFVYSKGIAYGYQMGLRPQTLYGIADSPVGLSEDVRAGFRPLRKQRSRAERK